MLPLALDSFARIFPLALQRSVCLYVVNNLR
jgi:hypothetical protein